MAFGTAVLVLIVMPQFDILTNLFITGGVCFASSLLQIIFRLQKISWKIIYPICSIILILTGYALVGMDYYVRVTSFVSDQDTDAYWYVAIGIFACLLVSMNWWENPLQASNTIEEMRSQLDNFRDFASLVSSLLRMLVTGAVWAIYYNFIVEKKSRIVWDDFNSLTAEMLNQGLSVLALQAVCSALCHWFGVVACKIHSVKSSFAIPLFLTGPATLMLGLILFLIQDSPQHLTEMDGIREVCKNLPLLLDPNRNKTDTMIEISWSICRTSLNNPYGEWPFAMLALEGVCMWLGLLTATHHVWRIKVQRIERTSQLFVRRLYESAFIDQSMLLNTKMKVVKSSAAER